MTGISGSRAKRKSMTRVIFNVLSKDRRRIAMRRLVGAAAVAAVLSFAGWAALAPANAAPSATVSPSGAQAGTSHATDISAQRRYRRYYRPYGYHPRYYRPYYAPRYYYRPRPYYYRPYGYGYRPYGYGYRPYGYRPYGYGYPGYGYGPGFGFGFRF